LISVIIPTCNRNESLSRCLELLKPGVQAMGEDAYEVIVTDDSKDGIAQNLIHANYPFVKWVKGAGKGPAANRNNGAKHAKNDWLVFIDDDCLPDERLIGQYLNAIETNTECLAFEGAICPDDARLLKKDMAECPVNTSGNWFWSANICVNAHLFKQIGGFDENFLIAAHEDQDLYERVKVYSKVVFLPACIVIHPVRIASLLDKIKKMDIQFSNWMYYQKKHSSTPENKQFLKAAGDYIRFSVREIFKLNFKTSILYAISSIYCMIAGFKR